MNRLHVVVGVLINDRDEILITQRQAHQDFASYWEFPGGKKERHETAEHALIREFKEELAIDLDEYSPWFTHLHDYPHQSVMLDIWLISSFIGIPNPQEGQGMRWLPISKLQEYQFPEGNKVIIEALNAMSARDRGSSIVS